MRWWGKIEELINQGLNKFFTVLGAQIPQAISSRFKKEVGQKREKVENQLKEKALKAKTDVQESVRKARYFPFKEAAQKVLSESLDQVQKTVQENRIKGLLLLVGTVLLVPFKKIGQWFANLSPGMVLTFFTIGTISITAGINLYVSGRKIYDHGADRMPASVEDLTKEELERWERPEYYKQERRQHTIEQVYIPVTIDVNGRITRVTVGFTVQSSNRYIAHYLSKHEHEVKDIFYMTTETQVSEFPLTEEGKGIIKDKIKREINEYLKSKKVEGEIEEVHLVSTLET